MSTININVVNQSLNVSAPFLVGDSIDYIEVRGVFSSDWDDATKWVHFELADDTQEAVSYSVMMTDDKITSNMHINLTDGTWKLWVHGDVYDANDDVNRRITTNIRAITVHESGAINGEVFPEITPSFAEQVLAIAEDAKRLAEDVVEAAERGEFDGARGPQGNPGVPGAEGFSPAVTITDIEGGHNVNITDKAHPEGQSFNVLNGPTDHSQLTNRDANNQHAINAITGLSSALGSNEAVANMYYEGVDLTVKFADEIAGYSDEWAWIKARVTAKNFSGLNIHDYIPVTCTNGYIIKPEIAGINTYKGMGNPAIGDHIDWISKDLWPDTVAYNPVNNNNGFRFVFTGNGSTKNFVCDKNASNFSGATFTGYPESITRVLLDSSEKATGWTYDNVTGTLSFTAAPGNNVKVYAQCAIPFFASNLYAFLNSIKTVVPNTTTFDGNLVDVDYRSGGVYSKLPQKLKDVLSGKNYVWTTRCSGTALLTQGDNSKNATSLPLWLPDEMEIFGAPVLATTRYEKTFGVQYPCFKDGNRCKGKGNGGARTQWWLSVGFTNSSQWCTIGGSGTANAGSASIATNGFPVCFRITA